MRRSWAGVKTMRVAALVTPIVLVLSATSASADATKFGQFEADLDTSSGGEEVTIQIWGCAKYQELGKDQAKSDFKAVRDELKKMIDAREDDETDANSDKNASILEDALEQAAENSAGDDDVIVIRLCRDADEVDFGKETDNGVIDIDLADISSAGAVTSGPAAAKTAFLDHLLSVVLIHELIGLSQDGHDHSKIIPKANQKRRKISQEQDEYPRIERELECTEDGKTVFNVNDHRVEVDLGGEGGDDDEFPGCQDETARCLVDEFAAFSEEHFGEGGSLLTAWHNDHHGGLAQFDQGNFGVAIDHFEAYLATLRDIQRELTRDASENDRPDLIDDFGVTDELRTKLNRAIQAFEQSIEKYEEFLRLRKQAAQARIAGNIEAAEQLVNLSNNAVQRHVGLTNETVDALQAIEDLLSDMACRP